jgi:glucose-1-phosphate adenylyltransferase
MGNYLFSTRTLLKALHEDAANEAGSHDFGRDILPLRFSDEQDPGRTARYAGLPARRGNHRRLLEADMDLRAVKPLLNLYNRQWPPRTSSFPDPPAKFTFDDQNRRGEAVDSIVSGDVFCRAAGSRIRFSGAGFGCMRGPRWRTASF